MSNIPVIPRAFGPLTSSASTSTSASALALALGLMLTALITGCHFPGVPAAKTASAAYSNQDIILRLHGSNTIGAKMAPALAAAFLTRLGADSVTELPGTTAEEAYIRGRFGKGEKVIEIWSYGSNTGFNDLAWGKCDIGMSSKPIDNQNIQRLAAFGNMRAPANEHVIGLDGIAIIVPKGNPLATVELSTVAGIFSGRIKDWSEVPRDSKGTGDLKSTGDLKGTVDPNGPGGLKDRGDLKGRIVLYTRDQNSGTFDVFRHSVLGKEPMSENSTICENNDKLTAAVAADPMGIGYAPVGTMQGDKALRIRSGESMALPPTKVNIVTEDYLLSRRLFLYTPQTPANAQVKDFIAFAQSEEGQVEVEKAGFVAQILRLSKPEIPAQAPPRYLAEIKGALRMAIDFRFHPGSYDIDNKARQDLGRLARFLNKENLRPCGLKLFGFCDNVGNPGRNMALSNRRASVVSEALHGDYGIEPKVVAGMGSALPIASNETVDGREKNRRIEVWLQCSTEVASADVQ